MLHTLRPALVMFALLSAVTGILYPILVTGMAQMLFPAQANGSLLRDGQRVVGSDLIGQAFDDPRYFWGRPSATSPHGYNAASSVGSNLGPLNPSLADAVRGRVVALRDADRPIVQDVSVPVDLVTTSGSGLDPHISPAAAFFQVARVARSRQIPEASVRKLVEKHIETRYLGLLGEPRVNVLRINIALDGYAKSGV